MMEFLDSLLCMFTSRVTSRNGSYTLEIPEQEIEVGSLEEGKRYRVALFDASEVGAVEVGGNSSGATGHVSGTQQQPNNSEVLDQPPVDEGEIREVELEDIGEKGDGIARIPPGYVVFVENTSPGDRVRIEITEARDNFAFADVVGQI
ncbi:TRAM domain-containing protein [Haloplanus salinarum]